MIGVASGRDRARKTQVAAWSKEWRERLWELWADYQQAKDLVVGTPEADAIDAAMKALLEADAATNLIAGED